MQNLFLIRLLFEQKFLLEVLNDKISYEISK